MKPQLPSRSEYLTDSQWLAACDRQWQAENPPPKLPPFWLGMVVLGACLAFFLAGALFGLVLGLVNS